MNVRPQREKDDVERYLVRRVKSLGGLAPKVRSEGENGWPDRLVVFPGARIGFIETKIEDGEPSEQQLLIADRLRRRGVKVFFAFNRTDVDLALAEIQAG